MDVILDGQPLPASAAAISVFDWGLQRGDGAFEVIRVYDGKPFALAQHLDRLRNSADLLGLSMPNADELAADVNALAASGGDCLIRIVLTRGGNLQTVDAPPRTIMTREPLPEVPVAYRLLPLAAPWHGASGGSELTGAKTISYAANMAASRHAHIEGYDDALLLGPGRVVLEGPTFSVGWVIDGVFETPGLDLNILSSITRAEVLKAAAELGVEVREVTVPLDRLLGADEVLALSTVREVAAVSAVGTTGFEPGPVGVSLAAAFVARREAEAG